MKITSGEHSVENPYGVIWLLVTSFNVFGTLFEHWVCGCVGVCVFGFMVFHCLLEWLISVIGNMVLVWASGWSLDFKLNACSWV